MKAKFSETAELTNGETLLETLVEIDRVLFTVEPNSIRVKGAADGHGGGRAQLIHRQSSADRIVERNYQFLFLLSP